MRKKVKWKQRQYKRVREKNEHINYKLRTNYKLYDIIYSFGSVRYRCYATYWKSYMEWVHSYNSYKGGISLCLFYSRNYVKK